MDKLTQKEWLSAKCDKYDYIISGTCGALAGIVDVFFVGDPQNSKLLQMTDVAADKLVERVAQFLYKTDKRTNSMGKPKKAPDTLEKSISYLEQAFPVNYDARYAKDLNISGTEEVLKHMSPANHHLLSLAHSADPIGLICSIISQFTNNAIFVDNGQLISFTPAKEPKNIPYIHGYDFKSKIFCGFVNWIGHLISDVVGSSSTRKVGKTGRGAGIAMPFYEIFLLFDWGDFNGNTFAETMTKVYETGYDVRFGAAQAIPVVTQELMVRCIWSIRQKFFKKKSWEDSIPTQKHADLRVMLLVSNSSMCLVDGTDAVIRGIATQNWVTGICRLNLVGWTRLTTLAIKEVGIRLGILVSDPDDPLLEKIFGKLNPEERECIVKIEAKMREYISFLDVYSTLITSLNEYKEAKGERAIIEKECSEMILKIHKYREEIGKAIDEYLCSYFEAFESGFNKMETALVNEDVGLFIEGNVVIQDKLNKTMQFTDSNSFCALMDSDESFIL